MSRWRPRRDDALLAAALGAVTLALTALSGTPGDRAWWPGGALLVAGASLVLAWRGRAPVAVLVLTVLTAAPYYWLGYPDGPASLLVAVAVYTVAVGTSTRTAVVTGLALLAVWIGAEQVVALATGPSGDGDRYVWLVVTVAAGVAAGSLRRAQFETEQRVEEQARRRVESERLRLAREVHDVVSHSLASIAVQAGVGAHVADRRPEEAVVALREIRDASRQALDELRAVLAVLREEGQQGEAGDLPGPRRLDEIEEVRGVAALAGVEVVVRGEPGALPTEVDDAAFHVVREAVTNTLRHARRAGRVVVELHRTPESLRVRVSDDGEGDAVAPVPGHGLRGLDERASTLGGQLSAGPRGGGAAGFRVEAVLPVGAR